jgi:hypothetical protein
MTKPTFGCNLVRASHNHKMELIKLVHKKATSPNFLVSQVPVVILGEGDPVESQFALRGPLEHGPGPILHHHPVLPCLTSMNHMHHTACLIDTDTMSSN